MKRFITFALAAAAMFSFTGCKNMTMHDQENAEENAPGRKTSRENIFDNGLSSAYIKQSNFRTLRQVDNRTDVHEAEMIDLIVKKEYWQKKYPYKKILTITAVTGDDDSGFTRPVGLLIHYEIDQSKKPAPETLPVTISTKAVGQTGLQTLVPCKE